MDGALLTTPEFEGVNRFDKSQVCLPAVRVATRAAFVFVNLYPERPATFTACSAASSIRRGMRESRRRPPA